MILSFFVSAAFEDLFSLWYAPDGRVTIALELRWSIEWFEAPLGRGKLARGHGH